MATCADIGRAAYPPDGRAADVVPLQGRSLLPLATCEARRISRSIFWEHEGNRAIRNGAWKLVRKYPGEWELYNMDEDRTELRNLAQDRPREVKDMAAEWQKWADGAGVLPWEQVSKELKSR